MKVKLKRFDKSLPIPEYKTEGAACFDVYSREATSIKPGELAYIPLNIAIEVPKNYWVMLVARSSTHKMGIMLVNGIGVGDQDFSGDGDEYKAVVLNFTKKLVTLEKGTRVAQMMVVPYEKTTFEEVDHLENKDRGGFGTTGKK